MNVTSRFFCLSKENTQGSTITEKKFVRLHREESNMNKNTKYIE